MNYISIDGEGVTLKSTQYRNKDYKLMFKNTMDGNKILLTVISVSATRYTNTAQ